MIHFKAPKILEMHSGHIAIELTESGTWETFPKFAEEYAEQIGAILIEEIIWKNGDSVAYFFKILDSVEKIHFVMVSLCFFNEKR